MLPDFSFDITNKVMSIRNQVNYLESSRAILVVSDSLSKIYKSANIGAMHTLKSFNDAENVRKLSGVSSLE